MTPTPSPDTIQRIFDIVNANGRQEENLLLLIILVMVISVLFVLYMVYRGKMPLSMGTKQTATDGKDPVEVALTKLIELLGDLMNEIRSMNAQEGERIEIRKHVSEQQDRKLDTISSKVDEIHAVVIKKEG